MFVTNALAARRHARGPQWARNKIESTVSAEKYVGQVGPYCAVVVTWFCASVFGRFLMLSPALRVFEVMTASRSNC